MYVAISGGTLLPICDVTTVQLSNGTVHKFLQNFSFHENVYLPSFVILTCVRAEMNVHAFMNELDEKESINIQEKLKIMKLYVQSQWRVVLL